MALTPPPECYAINNTPTDRDLMIRYRMALEAITAKRAYDGNDAMEMKLIANRAMDFGDGK